MYQTFCYQLTLLLAEILPTGPVKTPYIFFLRAQERRLPTQEPRVTNSHVSHVSALVHSGVDGRSKPVQTLRAWVVQPTAIELSPFFAIIS